MLHSGTDTPPHNSPVVQNPVNLIAFGFNPWSSMWKRTQTLLFHLQRDGAIARILFVNPSLHVMDLVRRPDQILSPACRERIRYFLPRQVSQKIHAYSPTVFPLMYQGKALESVHRAIEMRVLRPYLENGYILYMNSLVREDNAVFWELFERARYRVFDWSDDFSTFAANENERLDDERITRRFIEGSDLVVAVNEKLALKAVSLNHNSYCLRNGTNYEHMRLADAAETTPHRLCSQVPKPIIGYMGYMNPTRIDTDLVLKLAQNNPSWQFVFVGPQVTEHPLGTAIPRLPNVHVFPAVPYSELPGVLKCFDVCVIPNRINEHTAGNDPIKLFDYLASGRPIVSTRTAGLEAFGEVVDIADGPADFAGLIRKHLERGDDPAAKARRLRAAFENSWETRADVFRALLQQHLFRDQKVT
jgi:glycosyltransferase involved in cell wall biosynthesis